jgi:hypothetical protein
MYRPQADEYPVFYKGYIDTVKDDVLAELEHQIESFTTLLKGIPEEKSGFAYAEGTFSDMAKSEDPKIKSFFE